MIGFAANILERNRDKNNEVAIVDKNGSRENTWKVLREQVFRIAAYVQDKGFKGIVPLCMDRGLESAATVLGFNLAGVAVAPQSIKTPEDRCRNIAEQVGNDVWTIDSYIKAAEYTPAAGSLFDLSKINDADYQKIDTAAWTDESKEVAYVVFTSGSTGNPKGVLLNNKTIYGSMLNTASDGEFDYQSDDIVLQTASLSFIAYVTDQLTPLYAGSMTYVLPEEARGDNAAITDFINKYAVTKTIMPPQQYRTFDGAPSIRRIITGSDRIVNIAPKGDMKLIGIYGSSETAANSFTYNITEATKDTPIGVAMPGFKGYLLDEEGNLSDEGEMCMSGNIALGYLNLPEKTAEVFTPNPFCDEPGHEVLFHSGDLAKRLEDGNYLYINRMDNMIKVNGQRVEPGEIESVMTEFGGIKEAVVRGFTDEEGRSILVGYYTGDKDTDEEALRTYLASKLPNYMVPVILMHIDAMPLNANGKIYRRALTMPDISLFRNEYEAPRTRLEHALCRGFEIALHIDKVGVKDDFLRLGGDSISAMNVVKACSKYDISISDILEGSNPRAIAALVEHKMDDVYSELAVVDRARLTDSQMGVYLECMLQPESCMYNIAVNISTGKVDMTADQIKVCLDNVIRMHPALYSHLEEEDESVLMCKADYPEEGICVVNGNVLSEEQLEEIKSAFVRPFDMKKGPLCRVEVYFTEDKMHIMLDMHHIVSDGSSLKLIYHQLCDALAGKATYAEKIDPFSLYEAECRILESVEHDSAADYWERLLGDVETDSSLVNDYKSEEGGLGNSQRIDYRFASADIIEQVKKTDITLNTLFMGAFGYALAKMTGQTDSLFAVGESGRPSSILDKTVSMMVRTLPVVMNIDENRHGRELLAELQNQFFSSMRHDSISFSELNHNYGVTSDIAFVYQSDMFAAYDNGTVSAELEAFETGDAFAKLNTSVLKEKDEFIFRVEYRKDLYKESTIKRFVHVFLTAVNNLLEDAPMKEIKLTSDEDTDLLKSFNETDLDYDRSETFVDLFEKIVAKYPDKTAVVFKDKRYTYAELDDISDRIAAYVHGLGIGTEQTVSVIIPRCEYMAIATMGVLKAGAIYEPMDPSYPSERLTLMHTDADAKLVIADREMIDLLPEYKGPVLYTDEIPDLPAADAEEVKKWAPALEDTYVLLYTSGTTGTPKGCPLSHKNLSAFVAAHTKTLEINNTCKLTLYPSYGFDAHMADLYPAMANGCELYVIPDEMRLDFPILKDYLESNEITHMMMTTQVARQFILEYSEVKGLKCISTGGESLLSLEPNTNYKIINLYGPSETTVCITEFLVDRYYDPIPIGHANANSHLYICDAYGRQVPVGVPGELIISGPQVSKGYLNRPEKTAEAFVPNTFEENPDEYHLDCYKTGDICRFLENGDLEFIGRRDLQVKIRGFRIELSEVEQAVRSYPGISDATVVAVDGKGGKQIHAYIVSKEEIDIADLNKFIKSMKPAYMVPAATMQIDSIPLTVNQKVDKRKLPPIVSNEASGPKAERSMTRLEEELAAILKDIVGDCDADVQTEFEDAGITSISSIKLASQIYKKYGLHITSKDILEGGTILSVENMIIDHLMEGSHEEKPEKTRQILQSYPLTETQMGIYLDSMRAGIEAYNIPLLMKLPQDTYIAKLKQAIKTAVQSHPSMLAYIYADEKGDVALYPALDMQIEINEITQNELNPVLTEFEFTQKPLFNFTIINVGDDKYLLMEVHHIIGDGESMTILVEDIDKAYRDETIEAEEFTAFDLSLQEQAARGGIELRKARDVYDSIFRGVSSDYQPCRDRDEDTVFATHNYPVGASINKVEKFCTKHGITHNVLFTSVFAMLVAKYTSHEDALFTTIYNGRIDPRTERLVSMLVKTLPLYIQADAKTAVADFLKSVEKQLNVVKANDIFSFADAAREFGISADLMFIYQGKMMSEAKLDGKIMEQIPVDMESPKADLTTEVYEYEDCFGLTFEYNGGHYSEAWIESFADAYSTCLDSLLKAETLADVEITSDKELHKFDDFNDTDIEVRYRPVYMRLCEQAEAQPDRVAIVASPENPDCFKDAEGSRVYETLTYAQLDNMTNYLAHELIEMGITPDTAVGVMTGRSKEVYIGEFGILKAGCPFVFLSPSYPLERISYICEEASIRAIVTTHAVATDHIEMFGNLGLPLLYADDIDADVKAECPGIAKDPDSLAYMIYTSGSTGKPKGVMITNKGLNNISDNNEKNLQLRDLYAGVMAAVSAFTFDASIIDGYVSLANGQTLCIASEEDIHNPVEFCRLCSDNGVKSFICTPSFAMSLWDCPDFEKVAQQLHAVCCGGEVYPPALYEKFKAVNPNINLLNAYGPSEATICCSARVLASSQKIDIGVPISNYKLYIIDRQNHILPEGALGELVILGVGVGKGYLNRDDLTKKVYFTMNGEAAYKTGDLALITHDDSIEFHGRMDNQVKLRGLRVELGEIENAINSYDGVKNSIVLVKGQENNQYLMAYYTADRQIDSEDIRAEISMTLTEYMVPRILIQLDEMPMTANGKIDKKALPEVAIEEKKREYVAPTNPTEEALCEAFANALGLEKVGVTEDFFELGGTSLTATKIAMFAMSHDIAVAYKDVFMNPTVKQLSALVGTAVETTEDSNKAQADDYTYANQSLAGNTWNTGDDAGYREIGNVLLTGATGFLGMHMLKHFLDTEKGDIYCLLRKGSFTSAELRLNAMFIYYFDDSIEDMIGNRVHCIEGDITDREQLMGLRELDFDTIINCAACVKHFVKGNLLENVNVNGVKYLTELCLEKGSRLIHVSTISVAGEGMNGTPNRDKKLHENAIFYNQILDNQYILTKFKAEKIVLDAVAKGLDAKIMRAGNLMPRFSDGEFQINYMTNGFMRQLHGYYALGCIPYSALSGNMEFSPIDDTAGAMLALAHTDSRYTVFHTYNVHSVYMSDVIMAMNKAGLKIECVSEEEFGRRLKAAMENTDLSNEVGGLIAYLNRDNTEDRYMLGWENDFTGRVLDRIGYRWNITSDDYLVKAFRQLEDLGFFTIKR